MIYNRPMGLARIENGHLYYEVDGAGEPVVLVHGFSLDGRMWDDTFARLARDHRVVRYALRGFGRSSPPEAPFAHFDDLAALVAQLGLGRAHVIGLSLGGGVALDFALTRPSAVRSLVLVDSVVGGYAWKGDDATLRAARRAGLQLGLEAAKAEWLQSP